MAVDKVNTRQLQLAALQKAVSYTKERLKYTTSTKYTDASKIYCLPNSTVLTTAYNSFSQS